MSATVAVAVISMIVLGVLFGVGLVAAAHKFSTDEDPKVKLVLEALPGINCGACGYKGCHPYAEAVVAGEEVDLCVPGGTDAAQALADIMGVELDATGPRFRAVVTCQGGTSRCGDRFQYVGEADCRAANITAGGPKACQYGCLGFGTCAEACPFGAIRMNEERLPVIDPDKCTACGICVRTCPRSLCVLIPMDAPVYLACASHGRAKAVKDICEVGCIGCSLCARKDPNEAIEMVDNLPVLDFEKSGGQFHVAAEVCPQNCFVVEGEPATEEAVASEAAGA
jgi:Na+-translocating ferredoxin:NAD+ oxidoreductase RNF subunit RnfB